MTTTQPGTTTVARTTASFDRFAGVAGVLAAAGQLSYAVAFLVLSDPLLAAICLLLTACLASPLWLAVYARTRGTALGFAEWGTLLVLVGALGSAVHGAYDLATSLTPSPAQAAGTLDPIDPRGILTFGAAGVGLFVLASLFLRSGAFPRWVGWTGLLFAVLSITLYIGRLVVVDPQSTVIVGPAVLNGFLVGPLVLVGLGAHLLRHPMGPCKQADNDWPALGRHDP